MTSKHRYYTKKASSAGLTWIVGNDNQQLYVLSQIHKDMISNKKLSPIKPTLDELFLMRDNLKEGFQILTGFHNELPVTGCLVLLFGKKAFYMAAATSLIGREISAAYAMFARLMQELIDRGFTDFDFGGIAPNSKSAQGVNHYKCGFGGEVVQYLGEWEFACSEKYRIPINLAIRLKADRT
jgi:lipid II:glycine glycyltransferase (peptidoglycan interpeptide bridge formation enzyme)